MKKLIFGLLVAVSALTFSAFTTKHESRFTDQFYALYSDGNYHRLDFYDAAMCLPNTGSICSYKVATGMSLPNTVYSAAQFGAFVAIGYAAPYGDPNRKYYEE